MDAQRMKLQGKWEQVRGKVKEAWGSLTDDDLDRTEGQWDQLVGTIRERTGETQEAVERRLSDIVDHDQELA